MRQNDGSALAHVPWVPGPIGRNEDTAAARGGQRGRAGDRAADGYREAREGDGLSARRTARVLIVDDADQGEGTRRVHVESFWLHGWRRYGAAVPPSGVLITVPSRTSGLGFIVRLLGYELAFFAVMLL